MARWPFVMAVAFVVSLAAPTFAAENESNSEARRKKYDLTGVRRVGDVVRIEGHLEVGGHLNFTEKDAVKRVAMNVSADLLYAEKLLRAPAKTRDQLRSIRQYDRFDAAAANTNLGFPNRDDCSLSRASVGRPPCSALGVH